MNDGFKKGWEDGKDFANKNYHVDQHGNKNLHGHEVRDKMITFTNKPHGYDAGFAEGLISTLGRKP